MTDNKEVILQSRIEQLESEKSDLLEALEKTYRALCCNCYTRCEGCKIRNINDNILKKHGVEMKYRLLSLEITSCKACINYNTSKNFCKLSRKQLTNQESYFGNIPGWCKLPEVEGIREKLASYAHKQWSGWMEYLFSKSAIICGIAIIPAWAVERWKRQIMTSYDELSEPEKESDRKEADGMIEIFCQRSFCRRYMFKPD